MAESVKLDHEAPVVRGDGQDPFRAPLESTGRRIVFPAAAYLVIFFYFLAVVELPIRVEADLGRHLFQATTLSSNDPEMLLRSAETALEEFGKKASDIDSNDQCDLLATCSSTDACSRNACYASSKVDAVCTPGFNTTPSACGTPSNCSDLLVSFEEGYARCPAGSEQYVEIKRDICKFRDMDEVFKVHSSQATFKSFGWSYIGTISGTFRIYPGMQVQVDDKGECAFYDPRYRPWFKEASSPRKNVIIVQGFGSDTVVQTPRLSTAKIRLEVAKSTMIDLLGTFRADDQVGLILYTDRAWLEQPLRTAGDLPGGMKVPLGLQSLSDAIRGLDAKNAANVVSNLKYGIQLAIANLSMVVDDCVQQIIIVLSSGEDVSDESVDEIVNLLNANTTRQSVKNLRVYFHSIGAQPEGYSRLQNLSCMTDSILGKTSGSEMQLLSLTNYFNYLAYFQRNSTFWTSAYLDATHLGTVISVAKPVFRDGTNFTGVVSLDVRYPGGQAWETAMESRLQNKACNSHSACTIQALRGNFVCPYHSYFEQICRSAQGPSPGSGSDTCNIDPAKIPTAFCPAIEGWKISKDSRSVLCCGTCVDGDDEGGPVLSKGAIIGISAAGAVVALFLVALCFWNWKKGKRDKDDTRGNSSRAVLN